MRSGGSTGRGVLSTLAATAVLVVALWPATLTGSGSAHRARPGNLPGRAAPPLPGAYALVDADTGRVLAAAEERKAMRPASTIKLLTALMAAERLAPTDVIPISALAEAMPARKMNVKATQQWNLNDLMHAMLMVSANDAAVAIAEHLGGGSLDGWAELARQTADRLGLVDHPVLKDPAGLDDDEFAYGGGSHISARDMAIVARAVMGRPDLLAIIQTPIYEFLGGDGLGHRLRNQDLFLSLYEGATGLKTGATELAGRTFVGSATRAGRSMLVVIFDAVDPLLSAQNLLDQGFAMPAEAQTGLDTLPPVVTGAALDPPPAVARTASELAGGSTSAKPSRPSRVDFNSLPVSVAVFVCGLVLLAFVRRVMLSRFEMQKREVDAAEGAEI